MLRRAISQINFPPSVIEKYSHLLDLPKRTWCQMMVGLALLYYRRPEQFLNPYLWVEDGTVVFDNLKKFGVWGVFEPVNGFLILSSSIINYLSVKISFELYPYISAALTIGFTLYLIKRLSQIQGNPYAFYVFALAILFTPNSPEVLAVGEYSFWVIGAYVFGVFFLLTAHPEKTLKPIDIGLVGIGMMSGPFSSVVFAIWGAVNVLFVRSLSGLKEVLLSRKYLIITATITIAIQAYFYLTRNHVNPTDADFYSSFDLAALSKHYFGSIINAGHTLSPSAPTPLQGAFVFTIIMVVGWLTLPFRASLFANVMLIMAIGVNVARLYSSDLVQPFHSGPRYFFYPYCVIMFWLFYPLLVGYKHKARVLASGVGAVLFLYSFSIHLPQMQKRAAHVDWKKEVNDCRFAVSENPLLVMYDGTLLKAWESGLNKTDCNHLVTQSLFRFSTNMHCTKYPMRPNRYYDVCDASAKDPNLLTEVRGLTLKNKATFIEYDGIFGTRTQGDLATGHIELNYEPGAILAYRNGHAHGSQKLILRREGRNEFHELPHSQVWRYVALPDGYFAVMITDEGNKWGEWIEVKIK